MNAMNPMIAHADTRKDVEMRSYHIPSDTTGIELHIQNKRPRNIDTFDAAHTIVMMHGATYSSLSLYDTQVGGYSFMDYLAVRGYDVYAVDVRGYGRSTRPVEMDHPPEHSAPLTNTEMAIRDFSSAMNFVLRTNGITQANVIGMSWGGTVTGAYTTRNGHKVRRLGLIAPQWLSAAPIPLDSGGALAGYRIVQADAARTRWINAAPVHKRSDLIPHNGFEAWLAQTVGTETDVAIKNAGAIRATNGPIQDIRDYWSAGRPFYDPSEIEVPVLLMHGEWDIDVPIDLALGYFKRLTGTPSKRWIEIGEATHMLVLEKNRQQAFDALADFFIGSTQHS